MYYAATKYPKCYYNRNTSTPAHACNHPVSQSSSENLALSFLLSYFQLSSFTEPAPTVDSVESCPCLTSVEPNVVFCCRCTFASRFDVLCFLRCFLLITVAKSSYLGHHSLLVGSKQFMHSPLTYIYINHI